MNKTKPKWWLVATLATVFPLPALALGDLMVTPTRVILEGRQQSAIINIVNTGNEPATYRIMLVNQRMTEDGRFEENKAPKPEDRTADHLIRYSPRQAILPAGGSQVIRVQYIHRPETEDGEYRSHLLFRSIPSTNSSGQASASSEISVKLIPVYGISIPIIVRQGTTSADVSLSDLRIENHKASVRLHRSGTSSVYGNLTLDFIPKVGKKKNLHQMNGIAVYYPNSTRTVTFPYPEELKHGLLKATFLEKADAGTTHLAETQLEIP